MKFNNNFIPLSYFQTDNAPASISVSAYGTNIMGKTPFLRICRFGITFHTSGHAAMRGTNIMGKTPFLRICRFGITFHTSGHAAMRGTNIMGKTPFLHILQTWNYFSHIRACRYTRNKHHGKNAVPAYFADLELLFTHPGMPLYAEQTSWEKRRSCVFLRET